MYGLHVMGYIGIALIISAISSPTIFGEDVTTNFISKSSEDITQTIFQTSGKNEANYIFSPFGYSVILGILSEGARGETREELTNILHQPENEGAIRKNFKSVLQRLHERSASDMPEFRNYFYVYKNFTIDDDYKATLLENYYTDVRSVDRNNYASQASNESAGNSDDIQVIEEPENTSSTTEDGVTLASSVFNDPTSTIATKPSGVSSTESTILKSKESERSTGTGETMRKLVPKYISRISFAKTLMKDMKGKKKKVVIDRNRLKRLARRFLGIELDPVPRSDEMTNRINGEAYRIANSVSRMLVFNGLYFKGYWKIPFQRSKGEETFYKNGTEKMGVKMMFTTGEFDVTQIPDLDSTIISLPYKNERYSFMIILPNRRDGLQGLINGLHKFDLHDVRSKLERRHMHVAMPVFQYETTSFLKDSLKTIGVRRIFTREADFTGLSRDSGLFIDDIVQLVTIKVDNEAGTPNFMTASSIETRTVTEKFHVDHPFVFLIVDRKDDLIMVAGQVSEPTKDD